ncbi:hypothetical protein BBMA_8 [Burkholderia pseudomallei MSHR1079]|nr:hypothetical protein BBMA_8 [Burkholderia pseudomallei MSHR1079]
MRRDDSFSYRVARRRSALRRSPIAAHAAALSRIRARARRMARIRFEPHEASRATSGDDRTRVERCGTESARAHPADPVDMKRQLYEECAERRQSFVSRARQWWRRARCACAGSAIGTVKSACARHSGARLLSPPTAGLRNAAGSAFQRGLAAGSDLRRLLHGPRSAPAPAPAPAPASATASASASATATHDTRHPIRNGAAPAAPRRPALYSIRRPAIAARRRMHAGRPAYRFASAAGQNTSARTSMLRRGAAVSGVVGSSNAVCALRRARPSSSES